MNGAGIFCLLGAILLLAFVALIVFPVADDLTQLSGDVAVVPADDVQADCSTAAAVGNDACNLRVLTFDAGSGILTVIVVVLVVCAFLGLLMFGIVGSIGR